MPGGGSLSERRLDYFPSGGTTLPLDGSERQMRIPIVLLAVSSIVAGCGPRDAAPIQTTVAELVRRPDAFRRHSVVFWCSLGRSPLGASDAVVAVDMRAASAPLLAVAFSSPSVRESAERLSPALSSPVSGGSLGAPGSTSVCVQGVLVGRTTEPPVVRIDNVWPISRSEQCAVRP